MGADTPNGSGALEKHQGPEHRRFDLKREDSADETETEDEALACAADFRMAS